MINATMGKFPMWCDVGSDHEDLTQRLPMACELSSQAITDAPKE